MNAATKTHDSHPYEIPCPKCGSLAENDPMLPSGSHICEPREPPMTTTPPTPDPQQQRDDLARIIYDANNDCPDLCGLGAMPSWDAVDDHVRGVYRFMAKRITEAGFSRPVAATGVTDRMVRQFIKAMNLGHDNGDWNQATTETVTAALSAALKAAAAGQETGT